MPFKPPHAFKLILCDFKVNLCEAWSKEILQTNHFNIGSNSLKVEIHQAAFKEMVRNTKIDCIVSPGNSFGLMDGGADWFISELFGGPEKLIPIIQKRVEEEWCGEQNVGTSLLVNIGNLRKGRNYLPRYIAHTPSMRIPMKLSPNDDVVYLCTWAFLNAVKNHNRHNELDRIETVLCSGFGTGTGMLPVDACARQMILACSNFLNATVNSESNDGRKSKSEPLPHNNYLRSWNNARVIHTNIEKFSNNTQEVSIKNDSINRIE